MTTPSETNPVAIAYDSLNSTLEERLELGQRVRLAADKCFRWETLSEHYINSDPETISHDPLSRPENYLS
jgi:hypothetical protein